MPPRRPKVKREAEDENFGSKKVCHRKSAKTDDTFNTKRCTLWFEEYTSVDDPNVIGPEGIEKFCEDLGVEPENVAMLVIAWKMDAKRMGFFTRQEWLKGFSDLQCDCTMKLRAKIDQMKNMLHDNFKSIYRFAYDFARDKDQRSMDTETAKAMLHLLLGKHWKLYPQFHQFLDQSKYKVINKDQWYNILEFSRTINSDLSNYDVDGALGIKDMNASYFCISLCFAADIWRLHGSTFGSHCNNITTVGQRPVMLDEFVEWLRSSRNESAMQ